MIEYNAYLIHDAFSNLLLVDPKCLIATGFIGFVLGFLALPITFYLHEIGHAASSRLIYWRLKNQEICLISFEYSIKRVNRMSYRCDSNVIDFLMTDIGKFPWSTIFVSSSGFLVDIIVIAIIIMLSLFINCLFTYVILFFMCFVLLLFAIFGSCNDFKNIWGVISYIFMNICGKCCVQAYEKLYRRGEHFLKLSAKIKECIKKEYLKKKEDSTT